VREIAKIRAAPALRHGDAEQPLRAELWPQRPRKFVAAIDFVGQGGDLGGGKAPHFATDLIQRFAEAEVEIPRVGGRHGLPAPQFGS